MNEFPPISVEVSPGRFRTVRNARDAAAVVLTWPRGRRRLVVMNACLAAIQGDETPEKVRRCFIKAAEAAGVFVKEGEFPFERRSRAER